MRPKLVVANWKMNGSFNFSSDMANSLKAGISNDIAASVVVCPPFVYLSALSEQLSDTAIDLGAQSLSDQTSGAFTGEVSAEMLIDSGCRWVIVGHSERRALYAETSELVAQKTLTALQAGLNVIVCVGETIEERQSGATENVIAGQLKPILTLAGINQYAGQLVFAYEPVWAIGTGETASPEQAQTVHEYIRTELGENLQGVAILYGGSVKPANAAELFAEPDIDGGLIGGASLNAEDFLSICQAMPS